MSGRPLQDKPGWAWFVVVPIVKAALLVTIRRDWIHGERIPATGGCVLVLNHISHADPLIVARLVYDQGRLPHYLAKSSLFGNRALRCVLRALGQIPVERGGAAAAGAYDAAVAAVRRGECVVVYPEGTLTRDPHLWPMTGKSGAARIGLVTGCPVIPVGQWGAQRMLAPYTTRLHLFPRTTITMKVGEPVDLADLAARERTQRVVAEATHRIMDALTALVGEVRGETPPAERFDLRQVRRDGSGEPRDLPEQDAS